MSTYQELKGLKVKYLSSDTSGDRTKEGELFYNSNDGNLKSFIAAAAWHSSGPLLTARSDLGPATAGTIPASLAFGGFPYTASTEEYNGSGWATGGDLNTSRGRLGGAGTQTAAVGFGGLGPSTTLRSLTEEYNGSSWTESGDLSDARRNVHGNGTQTAALATGGVDATANTNHTEEYNGTSWTNGGDMVATTGSGPSGVAGTQTAACIFGLNTGSSPYNNNITCHYDGSSWTNVSIAMNTARRNIGAAGSQTAALAFGGNIAPQTGRTEDYNGTTWTETSDMSTARHTLGGAGTGPTSAIAFGGATPSVTSATEEFTISLSATTAAAFSSGGNLNTARQRGTGGGTLTAGICVNGLTVNVEEYNGTSWSEQNNTPASIRDMSGFGTQTAFVGCAGYVPGSGTATNATIEYDGSDWSSGGNMNTARDGTSLHFGGVLTAGLVNGGGTSPHKQTEEYNGTSWANANSSSQEHYRTNITGTQTAAFIFGGYGIGSSNPQPGLSVTFTEEYDGTNFSSGDTLLHGANAPLGMSNSNKDDSTCAGGFDQATSARLSLTQNYNGTVWATGASLGTARYAGTGGGSAAGGFVASGSVPPTTNATEELTAETTTARAVKTVDFD